MKVCCGGDTLCVVEHLSSVLLVKLGKSIRHCVPSVGVFYKLFLSSLTGILFLAGSLCLFHWTKSGPWWGPTQAGRVGISLSMKKESVDFLLPLSCPHGLLLDTELLSVRGSPRAQTCKLSGEGGEGKEPLKRPRLNRAPPKPPEHAFCWA